jgi:hypothetical protein
MKVFMEIILYARLSDGSFRNQMMAKHPAQHLFILAIDAVIFYRTALDRRISSVCLSNGAMAE